jgi:hypothetical protein
MSRHREDRVGEKVESEQEIAHLLDRNRPAEAYFAITRSS